MNSFVASFRSTSPGGPRGLHQQRHGTELVEGEESSVRRSRLHRQWRFELQKVLEVSRRQPGGRLQAEELRRDPRRA